MDAILVFMLPQGLLHSLCCLAAAIATTTITNLNSAEHKGLVPPQLLRGVKHLATIPAHCREHHLRVTLQVLSHVLQDGTRAALLLSTTITTTIITATATTATLC